VNFWHLNTLKVTTPKKDDFFCFYTTTDRNNKSPDNVQLVLHGFVLQHRDLTIDEIWAEHRHAGIDCGVDDEDNFRFGVIEACKNRSEKDLHAIRTGKLAIPCTTVHVREYMNPQLSLSDFIKRDGIAVHGNAIHLKYSLSGPVSLEM